MLKPKEEVNIRDQMALWLSLIPGLGHLYKGHVLLGGVILFLVSPLILGIALVLLPMTLGLSLLVPGLFMASGMVHAYLLPDRRAEAVLAARSFDQRPARAH